VRCALDTRKETPTEGGKLNLTCRGSQLRKAQCVNPAERCTPRRWHGHAMKNVGSRQTPCGRSAPRPVSFSCFPEPDAAFVTFLTTETLGQPEQIGSARNFLRHGSPNTRLARGTPIASRQ